MRKMQKFCNNKSYIITSITENSLGYTNRQFEQAKRARRLYHNVGEPTVENFKYMLRSNIIKDCPVTEKDANIVEKIFGQHSRARPQDASPMW